MIKEETKNCFKIGRRKGIAIIIFAFLISFLGIYVWGYMFSNAIDSPIISPILNFIAILALPVILFSIMLSLFIVPPESATLLIVIMIFVGAIYFYAIISIIQWIISIFKGERKK